MNIVVLDGHALNPGDLDWSGLGALGSLTVHDRTPPELVIERIGASPVVLVNKVAMTREVIERAKALRYIGVLATGYNVVDTKAAAEAGIVVTNIPAYGTDSVAQHVFAILLEICGRVGEHDRSVHAGDWARSADWCYWKHPLLELAGKTMGIIGYGKIGQKTARIAEAFGMRVVVATRSARAAEGARFVELDRLLAEADVVSLHCPLTEETRGLIDARSIAKMKDGAILVNTARGPLVVEADLAEALNAGKLAAAGADVVSIEPIRADNPLLTAKNMILTPHIAWAPRESRMRLMGIAADNLGAFLAGNPRNVVNP